MSYNDKIVLLRDTVQQISLGEICVGILPSSAKTAAILSRWSWVKMLYEDI